MTTNEKKPLIELFSLWENESKSGREYMTGSLGSARIVAFRNTKKQPGEKSPDWRVYVQERERDADGPTQATTTAKKAEDNIPF